MEYFVFVPSVPCILTTQAKKVMIDVLETGGRTGTVLFLKESLKNCLRDCDNSMLGEGNL